MLGPGVAELNKTHTVPSLMGFTVELTATWNMVSGRSQDMEEVGSMAAMFEKP